jgi:hypothetical protein
MSKKVSENGPQYINFHLRRHFKLVLTLAAGSAQGTRIGEANGTSILGLLSLLANGDAAYLYRPFSSPSHRSMRHRKFVMKSQSPCGDVAVVGNDDEKI